MKLNDNLKVILYGEITEEKRLTKEQVQYLFFTLESSRTGKNIVFINDIRFKGKRSINWDEVKKFLKELVGEFYTILETGDVVYIGTDLPDEYTGSNDTYGLKGTNRNIK